ncbi:MAG TPA: DUF1501 domain-containing protein [Planctomycetota bacterium]|jgi:Protein of unknown function (DUF1501)|nr:DUF1501 domain-containing protein [Planctomycetota bacterium]
MLNLLGGPNGRQERDWAPMSRRAFLRIGGMAAGGLSLSQLLSVEARAGSGSSHKSIINVFLPGGPSHLDTFDLKPNAPSEIRGEFRPISTNVPGIQICELFPRMARMMDKFALIRSIADSEGHHDGYQCMTGRTHKEVKPAGGWPTMAAFVSRLQGPTGKGVPPNLSLMYPSSTRTWGDPYGAGYVGPAHAPMTLVAKDPLGKPEGMTLQGISLERLRDRTSLLRSMDTFRRDADQSGSMDGVDRYGQQAMDILTTSALVDALDLSKEDPRIVERYGANDVTYQRDGAPRMVRNFLVARRLVEAGARVVSLNYSRWDWHGPDGMNFPMSRVEFPMLDQGLCALVTDLHERGLDKDVSVVVWGEFGRTPKINKDNSRDHWPAVTFALLAGGGMKTGQVIGATDRSGGHVTERPVSFQEVFATLYHRIGIDVRTATVDDPQGRPQYLVDSGVEPIRELL